MIEEQAKAIEELIATLTKNHTCQMETLIKSTTNAMKEFFVPRQEWAESTQKSTKWWEKNKQEERHF